MRIGFACKFIDTAYAKYSRLNFKTTTVKHLSSLPVDVAQAKLRALCQHNLECLSLAADTLAVWPEPLRMFRISGDVLPLFTHDFCHRFYVRELYPEIKQQLAMIGDKFRAADIRISFHPGQFTLLGTHKEEVVRASVDELEYHTMLLLDMGYRGWHDLGCAINIHAGSKSTGLGVVRNNLELLTPECRDFLTIENDEFSYGLTQLVEELGDVVAILPDLHHEWIYSGDYVPHGSSVLAAVERSWRGVRPKMHCSCSPMDVYYADEVPGEDGPPCPMLETRQEVTRRTGSTRLALRRHSYSIWHQALVEYYGGFTERFDVMVEAKGKNYASWVMANELGMVTIDGGVSYVTRLPQVLTTPGGVHQTR